MELGKFGSSLNLLQESTEKTHFILYVHNYANTAPQLSKGVTVIVNSHHGQSNRLVHFMNWN